MATRHQKKANRKNAKRSTGPRTPEGKARSSQNACKHGLFARDTVLPDENPQEFLELIADLEQELQAVGGFEHRLVRHIADTEWRMRRLVRLETGALTHQLDKERLYAQRVQAELGNLPPALQPKPGEGSQAPQPQPGEKNQTLVPEPADRGTPADHIPDSIPDSINDNAQPDADYQQTTRELGSAIVAHRDSPVLLTLSLYESRLNRKHLSLLKQLRLTQKIRRTEEAERHESADPRNQGKVPQPLPSETEARAVVARATDTAPPASEPEPRHEPTPAIESTIPRAPQIPAQQQPNPPNPGSTRASPPPTEEQQPKKPAARVA